MESSEQKSDAEISVAIENLKLMLDLQDVDVVIDLLQRNNWDEALAANEYFARQMSQQPSAPPSQTPGSSAGVRAPIAQRSERLIDDRPPASDALFAMMQQVNREMIAQQTPQLITQTPQTVSRASEARQIKRRFEFQNEVEVIPPPEQPGVMSKVGSWFKKFMLCSEVPDDDNMSPQELDASSLPSLHRFSQDHKQAKNQKAKLWTQGIF